MIRRHRKGCPSCCTCDTWLDVALGFGKHKGETLETVSEEDPGYIAWLFNEKIQGFHNIIPEDAAEECENEAHDRRGYDEGDGYDWYDKD